MSLLQKIPTILGAGGGSLLPPELQACEYLETDGNCYIITDLTPKNNWNTICLAKGWGDNKGGLFGCRSENGNKQYNCFRSATSGQIRVDCGTQSILQGINGIYNTAIKVDFNKKLNGNRFTQLYDVNGNLIGTSVNYTSNANPTVKMSIFSFNSNGSISGISKNGVQIWTFYIQDNDDNTLISQLYTCYIKSGKTFIDNKGNECPAGTAGMFDIQNGVLYTNDGTGTFTHGADINI